MSDEFTNDAFKAFNDFNFSDMMKLKEFLNIPKENMIYKILNNK
jgi:hypothetical protein